MDPNAIKAPDYSQLNPLREQSNLAAQNAIEYQKAGALLPSMLRDALSKKFSTNNPLVEQRGSALQGYMTAAEQAANEQRAVQTSGNPYSPTQLRSLQGQREAAALVPLANINYLLGQDTGTIGDIINSATGAFQAQTIGAQGAAQTARQQYSDKLDEIKAQQDAYVQLQKLIADAQKPDLTTIEANGRVVVWDKKTGKVVQDLGAAKSSGGSDNAFAALAAQILQNSLNKTQPSSNKPTMTPAQQTQWDQAAKLLLPGGSSRPPIESFGR